MSTFILVEVVGFEPTTFLMWRIYSPLPSTNSAHTSITHSLECVYQRALLRFHFSSQGPDGQAPLLAGRKQCSLIRCNFSH